MPKGKKKGKYESELQEKFEEKVLETIDALSARSNAARAAALVALRSAFQRRYLTPMLMGQRLTLADHVTRALRRGKDGERRAAASLAPILALQIGEEGTEEFMSVVRPALLAAAMDKTASLESRTECCSALAILCYLLEEDLTEVIEVMKTFESIFRGRQREGVWSRSGGGRLPRGSRGRLGAAASRLCAWRREVL
ncbi:unnamed protein product [Leptidea sinapis]|uniref:Interferon-related developmental regulator N-terminal domain-containing protein n=1 Tax=Leptidea sinapis TaxID=189913 RepID=A0A5E4QTP6_9NEOP|nr:unnamed protein product [Leptidea sinapis]